LHHGLQLGFIFYEKWLEKGIWYGPEAAHDDIDKTENE
jgi:hypothetical protein